MKKNNLLFLFLLLGIIANAQDWLYSSHFGGNGNNYVTTSATDSINVYSLGTFDGNVDDIGDSWGLRDIYLDKYSFDLNLTWRKRFGSDDNDFINYKGLLYDNNMLYFTGSTKGDCKFDSDTIFNTGILDAFGAKYNVDGALQWVKQIAWGPSVQIGSDVEILDNNLIFAGTFIDSMIVGDSIGAANIDTIYSYAGKDFYLIQTDNDGNYINNYVIHTTGNNSNINTIGKIGSDLYITGYFSDSLFYGTDTLVSAGGRDIFLMKFNLTSGVQWLRRIGGDLEDNIFTIAFSENNDIFISGYFLSSNLTIDSTDTELSTQTFACKGNRDAISLKYDENGTFQSVLTYGTINRDEFYGSSYKNNNLLLSGGFSDSLIIGIDTLRSVGGEDAFFGVFDADYNPLSAASVGGTGTDVSYDSEIDFDNNFVINGRFNSDTLFIRSKTDTTNIDTLINVNVGSYDSFIAKYGCRADIYPTFSVDTITCPGSSDGSASVFITTNGTDTIADNWTYLWSNADTDSLIENISEDTYTVTITSAKGCQYIDSIFVTNFPVLETVLADTLTLDCEASNNGMAIVTPSLGYQGTTGYTYAWDTGESDSTATQLTIGVHYVTVQDACGATTQVIDTINIGHIPTMQAHIQTQNVIVLCDTSSNGIGRVDYTDGKAPYSFYWENSNTDTTSAVANDLTVGWHYVTITDFCNVPIIDSVNIVNLPTIGSQITFSQNATCTNNLDGVATVTAFNGIEPYIYTWSASTDTTASVNNLPGDSLIYVTVSDICHDIVDSVMIGVNPEMAINFVNIQNTNCTNSSDGSAEVTLINEQGTVTYLWDNDSTTAINTALDAGYALVTVTDICGPMVDSVEIQSELPLAAGTVSTDNPCYGDSIGTATISTLYAFGTVQYIWNTGDTTSVIDSLATGTYYYTVTDECNDVISDSVAIESPTQILDSVITTNETVYGNADGTATLIITGGTQPYTVAWSNNDIGTLAEYLTAGTYNYVIRDANNCELSDSVVIIADEYEVVVYNAFTPNADGVNDVWNIKYIDKFPDATVQIFNQWGAEVFSSNGYSEPWDGTMDGKELPAGTYYYIIKLGKDYKDKSGSVTIIK